MRSILYVAIASALVCAMADAQVSPVVDPIKARQLLMVQMAASVNKIERDLAGRGPLDRRALETLVIDLRAQSGSAFALFAENSSIGSHARPEIWSQRETFEAKAAGMLKALDNLENAAQAEPVASLNGRLIDIQFQCIGCHATFKTP